MAGRLTVPLLVFCAATVHAASIHSIRVSNEIAGAATRPDTTPVLPVTQKPYSVYLAPEFDEILHLLDELYECLDTHDQQIAAVALFDGQGGVDLEITELGASTLSTNSRLACELVDGGLLYCRDLNGACQFRCTAKNENF